MKRKRQSVSWLLSNLYEKLADLTPGRPEKLALYDEQIQLHLKDARKTATARAMMEKAELVDAQEKIALYDKAIELLSHSKESPRGT